VPERVRIRPDVAASLGIRINMHGKAIRFGCLVMSVVSVYGQATGYLTVIATEGEGALNDTKRKISHPPAVRVVDDKNNPVVGAKVTFTMPALGPGGTFTGNQRSFATATGENGVARAAEFRPNDEEGRFNIRVIAEFNGLQAETIVAESNTSAGGAALGAKGNGKKLLILSLLGGGAAAVLAIVLGSHGGSTPPPAVPTVLSAGPITVGAPH
jgi:hypothetical protein